VSGNPHPYDYEGAKRAVEDASRMQLASETALKGAWAEYATKERAYRLALALKITELKAGGVAWSSTADLARGDKDVADLKYHRDVAEGVREAMAQAVFRHTANRRELEQLIAWSMRVAPDGQFEESPSSGPRLRAAS
jgi:hypothetical protein